MREQDVGSAMGMRNGTLFLKNIFSLVETVIANFWKPLFYHFTLFEDIQPDCSYIFPVHSHTTIQHSCSKEGEMCVKQRQYSFTRLDTVQESSCKIEPFMDCRFSLLISNCYNLHSLRGY